MAAPNLVSIQARKHRIHAVRHLSSGHCSDCLCHWRCDISGCPHPPLMHARRFFELVRFGKPQMDQIDDSSYTPQLPSSQHQGTLCFPRQRFVLWRTFSSITLIPTSTARTCSTTATSA